MKFFVDTADVAAISELNDLGMVDGVTTNPSLILKSGRDILEVTKEICGIVSEMPTAEAVAAAGRRGARAQHPGRHAGSAGPVELSTSVDGAGAILCVADRGAGAAALPRDATGAPCGGGRHGLDLVRDIARRQDAELSFTDRAGGGLLVRCRWPG